MSANIPRPVMSYRFTANFKSLTAILQGVDMDILAQSLCSIDGFSLMKGEVATFYIRADADNLVIKALTAIMETKTVHDIEDGVSVEVTLFNEANQEVLTVQLLRPEIVDFKLANLSYELSEAALFEVNIKYDGTIYVTT
jgi:hypothetical protein